MRHMASVGLAAALLAAAVFGPGGAEAGTRAHQAGGARHRRRHLSLFLSADLDGRDPKAGGQRRIGQVSGGGPANAFQKIPAYPPADFKVVGRPNFDTLYSSAWFDLTEGPVVMSLPDPGGRSYLMPTLDMWAGVIASAGLADDRRPPAPCSN